MNCCFSCFGFEPKFKDLADGYSWTPDTLENNINAVGYSNDSKDLLLMRKITNSWIQNLEKKPNRSTIEVRACEISPELKKRIDERLKEISLSETQQKIGALNQVNKLVNLIEDLKTTRECLNIFENEIRPLNERVKIQSQKDLEINNSLSKLMSLYNKAKREIESRSMDLELNSLGSTEINKIDKNAIWDVKSVSDLCKSIDQKSVAELAEIIEKVRVELTSCEKEMLKIGTELNSLNSSERALRRNITLLQQLEKLQNQKFAEMSQGSKATKKEEKVELDEVELNGIDSSQDSLQEHKIKGKKFKTYVALTGEKAGK